MDVCIYRGGYRGLHAMMVVCERGKQETCGARGAVDSEQT
jgi:hypothetical protein